MEDERERTEMVKGCEEERRAARTGRPICPDAWIGGGKEWLEEAQTGHWLDRRGAIQKLGRGRKAYAEDKNILVRHRRELLRF